MGYIKRFKDFFYKNSFDFDRSDIDSYKFHPQVQILFAIHGIFFNNPDSRFRFIWPLISIATFIVSTVFESLAMYNALVIEDYSLATECFCYLVVLGSVPNVYISVMGNRKKIMNLLDNLNTDFIFICTLGSAYRKIFLDGQLIVWKLFIAWVTFCMGISIAFVLNTAMYLTYQSLFMTIDEDTVRPMIFPIWLPTDDPHRTPNYELFFMLEILGCALIPMTFSVYAYSLFHLLLHVYTLMDVMIKAIHELFQGLNPGVADLPTSHPERRITQAILKTKIRQIIKWHQSVSKYMTTISSVYGPVLVYQVMFSALAICVIAIQIANELDDGKIDFLFLMLESAVLLQLWITCYIGTLIRNKAFAVGDACYNSGWENSKLGCWLRAEIVMIIMRSHIPVSIKFPALPQIELETFSSITSTAYSYFNMLRRAT